MKPFWLIKTYTIVIQSQSIKSTENDNCASIKDTQLWQFKYVYWCFWPQKPHRCHRTVKLNGSHFLGNYIILQIYNIIKIYSEVFCIHGMNFAIITNLFSSEFKWAVINFWGFRLFRASSSVSHHIFHEYLINFLYYIYNILCTILIVI